MPHLPQASSGPPCLAPAPARLWSAPTPTCLRGLCSQTSPPRVGALACPCASHALPPCRRHAGRAVQHGWPAGCSKCALCCCPLVCPLVCRHVNVCARPPASALCTTCLLLWRRAPPRCRLHSHDCAVQPGGRSGRQRAPGHQPLLLTHNDGGLPGRARGQGAHGQGSWGAGASAGAPQQQGHVSASSLGQRKEADPPFRKQPHAASSPTHLSARSARPRRSSTASRWRWRSTAGSTCHRAYRQRSRPARRWW